MLKGNYIFQPSIFRCENVSFREGRHPNSLGFSFPVKAEKKQNSQTQILEANVGKYSSPMEHMGNVPPCFPHPTKIIHPYMGVSKNRDTPKS